MVGTTLILGCGRLGAATATRLRAQGWRVIGVKRSDDTTLRTALDDLLIGDAADPAFAATLPQTDAVLITATPGLRRGRDNNVARLAALAAHHHPQARIVCTGTTAVYADAAGAAVDEHGALLDDAATRGLLAIEAAVLAHTNSLLLRVAAITGPGRDSLRDRLRTAAASGTTLALRGPLDRPFSHISEGDCAAVLAEAVCGKLAGTCGVLNCASPQQMSFSAYCAALEPAARIVADPAQPPSPSRAIHAGRLHALLGAHAWQRMV